ncbi:unnamed protein product [Toxocara canis]|uniref:Uncharacterized protein n=1 Tax=Toxocara canis TaxID=6265 RepID=A0A183TX60_TOXCA|nr:unnamed protein product [Toxocara canis]
MEAYPYVSMIDRIIPKDDENDLLKYRPISLLSDVENQLEKRMQRQVKGNFDEVLLNTQHAFIMCRATFIAPTEIMHKPLTAMFTQLFALTIQLDMSKRFDC